MEYHARVSDSPSDKLVAAEVAQAVRDAVLSIDHSQQNKRVVELYLDGVAEPDISKTLGVSLHSVYGVVKRMKERLRRYGYDAICN